MLPTIQVYSGQYFDYRYPHDHRYTVTEIAHALSNICRYTGHCERFYSVAQHSVLVSHEVPREYALQGLLHDAVEAYCGDVNKPLKSLLPEYSKIEAQVEAALLEAFGLPASLDPSVKAADLKLLKTEQRDLMQIDDPVKWYGVDYWSRIRDIEPCPYVIVPLPPKAARLAFIERYMELTGGAHEIKASA
jgi:hypothetical protein